MCMVDHSGPVFLCSMNFILFYFLTYRLRIVLDEIIYPFQGGLFQIKIYVKHFECPWNTLDIRVGNGNEYNFDMEMVMINNNGIVWNNVLEELGFCTTWIGWLVEWTVTFHTIVSWRASLKAMLNLQAVFFTVINCCLSLYIFIICPKSQVFSLC